MTRVIHQMSGRKSVAEDRQAAHGFAFRRLVLKHVPMLGEFAVLDANDISGDPGRGAASARKAAMNDDEIAFGQD